MDGTGISQKVIEEIRELAQKHSIHRVVLFGSLARGDFRRASDIDLAVEGGEVERFALDLDEDTSTLLKYDIVDLGREIHQALQERTNVTYSYNQKIALEIVTQAKKRFYDMFCSLKKEVEDYWL